MSRWSWTGLFETRPWFRLTMMQNRCHNVSFTTPSQQLMLLSKQLFCLSCSQMEPSKAAQSWNETAVLKYPMFVGEEYNIDGFRFDLMKFHDVKPYPGGSLGAMRWYILAYGRVEWGPVLRLMTRPRRTIPVVLQWWSTWPSKERRRLHQGRVVSLVQLQNQSPSKQQ